MKTGLLSICCLGYNHASYISDCITNIWKSSYRNIEIIILDDGSDDQSKIVIESLKKDSPFPIISIYQKNTGNIGLNFNRMIYVAQGEFISFIALDDILVPEMIEKNVGNLVNDSSIVATYSPYVLAFHDTPQNLLHDFPKTTISRIPSPSMDDLLKMEREEFHSFYVQGCIFRKNVVDRINGFDEDVIGDDIILRTKLFLYLKANPNYKLRRIEKPLVMYRQHGDNIHLNALRQLRIISEYLDKYWQNYEPSIIFKDCVKGVLGVRAHIDWVDVLSLGKCVRKLITSKAYIKELEEMSVYGFKYIKLFKSVYLYAFKVKRLDSEKFRQIVYISLWNRRFKILSRTI